MRSGITLLPAAQIGRSNRNQDIRTQQPATVASSQSNAYAAFARRLVMAIDPVCGMDVNENNPPAKTEYNGVTYYFCSQNCRTEFEEDPEEYLSSAA